MSRYNTLLRSMALRAILCGTLLAGPIATACAGTLSAIEDTYTDSVAVGGSANYGGHGVVSVSSSRIGLIRFDAAEIVRTAGGRATLNLKLLVAKNSRNALTVRLVREPWNESTVTANTNPSISTLVLDEKTLTPADQGKIVSFDVTGAVTAWRDDPAHNFGIAIVPGSPVPNVQFVSRELRGGATLTVSGLPRNDSRLWIATPEAIQLRGADGALLVSVPQVGSRVPPHSFSGAGLRPAVNDPLTGGVWVNDYGWHRLFRLGPSGAVELVVENFRLPLGLAVDPRDGGVWISTSVVESVPNSSIARDLIKLDRNGHELARIKGFGGWLPAIALDDSSRTLWVLDELGGSVVRLSGTDEQLNGYDAAAPTGRYHTRIPAPTWRFALDVATGTQTSPNFWVATSGGSPPALVKFTGSGTELFRRVPNACAARPDQSLRGLDVDPLTGAAIATCTNDGYAYFSATGVETRFVRVFTPQPHWSKVRLFLLAADEVTFDPYRNVTWSVITEHLHPSQPDGPGHITAYTIALDARGHQMAQFNDRGFGMDLQSIRLSLSLTPTAIKPDQNGLITVSVLSHGTFDALQVDPNSARFGPARAAPKAYHVKDVNGDGVADLTVDFAIPETGMACGYVNAGFTSTTYAAIPVAGFTPVTIQGCP